MSTINLSDWTHRKDCLADFQNALGEKFSVIDYNVFVFGSYIRNDFDPQYSDIDMVVYCLDSEREYDIAHFSKEYWTNLGLDSDILQYYYSIDATIFYPAILSSFKLTEYYPKQLKDELFYLYKAYEREQYENREKRKYMDWYFKIKKEKLTKGRE